MAGLGSQYKNPGNLPGYYGIKGGKVIRGDKAFGKGNVDLIALNKDPIFSRAWAEMGQKGLWEPIQGTRHMDEPRDWEAMFDYLLHGGGETKQTSFTETNEYKDLKWQIDNLRGLLDAKKDPTPISETPEYIQATDKLTAQEGQIGDLSKQLRALRAQGGSGWSSTMNRAPMGVKIKQSPGYKTGRTFQGAGGSFAKGGLRISGLNFA